MRERSGPESLRERVVRSSILVVGANVVRQSIGIVSMLILARLLAPEDYGTVAAAILVVALFDVLSQAGTDQYVLSRPDVTPDELHAAWTLRLGVRAALAVVVVTFSGWFARFFGSEELVSVLLVLAFVPVIEALQSPGTLLLRRDFQYRGLAMLSVGAKMVSFCVAVSIAITWRSYWALVAGSVTFVAVYTAGSYGLHAVRPKLTLSGVANQWNFSKWTLARNMVGYTRAKIDNFAFGRQLGITELGTYTLSKQLGTMPHVHLTEGLRDVLLSSIGGTKGRRELAARTFSRIVVILVSVMLPIAVGMHLIAGTIVAALLGPAWSEAVPIIEAMSTLTLTFCICEIVANTMTAIGRIREGFVLDLITMLLVSSVVLTALHFTTDLAALAWTRAIVGLLVAIVYYVGLSRNLAVDHRSVAMSLIPSILAGVVMTIAIRLFEPMISDLPAMAMLVLLALAGALVYFGAFALFVYAHPRRTDELEFAVGLVLKHGAAKNLRSRPL